MRLANALAALAALGLLAAPAAAAPPDVPAEIAYQGSLFDDTGAPRTGVVDLTVRIYDSGFGGTLLYKQEYLSTPLTDGVFTVDLGPVGAATDAPTDPLTTSFADVFDGDLVAVGPDRFLQLTVGTDSPLGRMQVLAAPFSVRTRSAEVADTAVTAQSADVATTTLQLGPYPIEAFTEWFENTNLDVINDLLLEGDEDADLRIAGISGPAGASIGARMILKSTAPPAFVWK